MAVDPHVRRADDPVDDQLRIPAGPPRGGEAGPPPPRDGEPRDSVLADRALEAEAFAHVVREEDVRAPAVLQQGLDLGPRRPRIVVGHPQPAARAEAGPGDPRAPPGDARAAVHLPDRKSTR